MATTLPEVPVAASLRTAACALGAVVLAELSLTLLEALLVWAPLVALAGQSLRDSGETPRIVAVMLVLLVLTWARATDRMRPVLAARATKLRGLPLTAAAEEAAQRAMARTPLEMAGLRWVLWTALSVGVAWMLAARNLLAWPSAVGVACVGLLHAGGAAAIRALFWERLLDPVQATILPNLDPLRAFAVTYRRRLCLTAFALIGLGHAVSATLIAVFTELTSPQAGTLLALTVPALLVPMLLWYRSLARRTVPIERYFESAIKRPTSRGLARDDPQAVAAFRAAQSLPYRASIYQSLACSLAAVAVVAVGRRLTGFNTAIAGRLLGAIGLMVLASGLYETLLLRAVLRPLLGQLGSRHRLPVAEVRSALGLRRKLLLFFGGVIVLGSGLVLLFSLSPKHGPATMIGSTALALALALGLVVLIVRDLVSPIHALEERADEMARGELARPVPPSGEADEIGRLTFAFEEMRRALRDKLRSTESLNIDLEREVRRRTEVLEQRNAELHDALEKLRRAQDDLVRTEKLASMGRLVAGIAHEINNPVNAVINTLGPLQESIHQISGAQSPQQIASAVADAEEMLRVVQRGAARSKAIVQALHNYSRGDESVPRELNLGRSVDDTVDLLRHRLKNIRVEKEIDPGLRVFGFPGQIDQVLMNLVTNAAQAIGDREQGGTIRIGVHAVDDEAQISVADDGPGIPAEVLPRIFDPFFTTKDVGEGSGLGLSIVHGIIERHGGRIRAESHAGEGTVFRIWLPLRPASASSENRALPGK
ncbi:MAG: two-component system, NtrC family, sensor kinase [Myxococcales bacterium]|nr:two-component system, NtrC family, sensor kinase [Myxococcales bacterium]